MQSSNVTNIFQQLLFLALYIETTARRTNVTVGVCKKLFGKLYPELFVVQLTSILYEEPELY